MTADKKAETLQKISRGEPALDFVFDQSLDVKWDTDGNLVLDCACLTVEDGDMAAVVRVIVRQEAVGILRSAIRRYEANFVGDLDSGVPERH